MQRFCHLQCYSSLGKCIMSEIAIYYIHSLLYCHIHSSQLTAVVSRIYYIYSLLYCYIHSSQPAQWLKLGCRHSLHKLVYIDHGIAYQFLRVEFRSSGACYTFLLRDANRCKLCSTQLSCELESLEFVLITVWLIHVCKIYSF